MGKSTLFSKVILNLRSRGIIIGGCVTSEKRVSGQRVGFRIRDLLTDDEGELASVTSKLGPRVGRYRVNLSDLSAVGGRALERAARDADLIVIDEIGPMELTSPDFRRSLRVCIDSEKPILAVVHERMNDPIIEELKSLSGEAPIVLGLENRDSLVAEVTRRVGSEIVVRDTP
jgi:nucleoside-triphosphatase